MLYEVITIRRCFTGLSQCGRQKKPAGCPAGFGVLHEIKQLLAEVDLDVPVLDLHGAVDGQVLLHLEAAVEQLRLMTDATGEAVFRSHVEVLLQDRLVP